LPGLTSFSKAHLGCTPSKQPCGGCETPVQAVVGQVVMKVVVVGMVVEAEASVVVVLIVVAVWVLVVVVGKLHK